MITRIGSALLVFVLSGSLVGCSAATPAQVPEGPSPSAGQAPGDAAGIKLAPGLYELADGSAQALGTLEYRDLEGGMWVLLGGAEATGDVGKTVAVIANPGELGSKLEAMRGSQVFVTGEKLDGASIRMAGPEIKVTTIVKVEDTADPAQ